MAGGIELEKVINLQDGDIVVVNVPMQMNPATLTKYLRLIADQIRETNPGKNLKVFATPPGVTIDKLDEPEMNAAGWIRKPKSEEVGQGGL